MHNHCFRFILGRLQYPGEIGYNGYAKLETMVMQNLEVNKMHYGLCENGE